MSKDGLASMSRDGLPELGSPASSAPEIYNTG